MGKIIRSSDEELPVTDALASRLLRLPCFFELSHTDQDRVIDAVHSFFEVPGS
jgi:dTDP-4-amino-4,6-dideoxygalactose transaminase